MKRPQGPLSRLAPPRLRREGGGGVQTASPFRGSRGPPWGTPPRCCARGAGGGGPATPPTPVCGAACPLPTHPKGK